MELSTLQDNSLLYWKSFIRQLSSSALKTAYTDTVESAGSTIKTHGNAITQQLYKQDWA